MELVQSRRSRAFSHAQRSCLKTEQGRICQLHLFNCFCHLSHGFASSRRRAPAVPVSFRLPLPSSRTLSCDTSPSGPGSPAGLCVSMVRHPMAPWAPIPVTHHHHHCQQPHAFPNAPAESHAFRSVPTPVPGAHGGPTQRVYPTLEHPTRNPTPAPISRRSGGGRGSARPAAPHSSPWAAGPAAHA